MKYDPALPVAVFLGPSLDVATARALLPANYYPPVRMGDVYRLMTCGVRLIAIIDGVFHKTTPVWQREIAAALRNGITVVGGSSMGALRAIELGPLGMLGVGTIVDWYRSGRIEGDDEVALQHADADYGYRALSEPLVNIRWNLERAEQAGIIGAAECAALTAAMQALDHGSRSYAALFASAAFAALSSPARERLRPFLSSAESLKASDARAVLEWCAAHAPRLVAGDVPAVRPPAASLPDRADGLMLRGIPADDRELVPVRDLLEPVLADAVRVAGIVHHAARRFYLVDWARHAGVEAPPGVVAGFERQWAGRHGVSRLEAWLAANGLTADEWRRELDARALAEWLLERGPQASGLDGPFLEAWAAQMGIERPDAAMSSEAFRAWMVERLPPYFGFDQWSADIALVRELQMSGELSRLARERVHARAV